MMTPLQVFLGLPAFSKFLKDVEVTCVKRKWQNLKSWTIKKSEHWRTDAFELWCWWRLLRVPWTARKPNQSILRKSVLNIHWKDWCWSWNSNTLAIWWEELTYWKRPWCWERLKVGGEQANRGWDGWMASLTQWTWVWASSRIWWWTGKSGVPQSMGSQRVWHKWVTKLNWKPNHCLASLVGICSSRRPDGCPGEEQGGWDSLPPLSENYSPQAEHGAISSFSFRGDLFSLGHRTIKWINFSHFTLCLL